MGIAGSSVVALGVTCGGWRASNESEEGAGALLASDIFMVHRKAVGRVFTRLERQGGCSNGEKARYRRAAWQAVRV